MKHKCIAAIAAGVFSVSISATALAQVSEDGMGKVLPVEIYACNYNEGQDAGDMQKAIEGWSRFMDDAGNNSYAAWTLTPFIYGAEQDFDFLWLGAYPDGNSMGSSVHRWLTEGGERMAEFNKVADCRAHILLGSAMYKAPDDQRTPESGIFSMMDCKLNDGHRYADIKRAELKWAKYLTENGSKAGYWHWFPGYGGGESDFNYKVVAAYRDFTEFGADFELNANGGGRAASREIFGDIDECDDARVYVATSIRQAELR